MGRKMGPLERAKNAEHMRKVNAARGGAPKPWNRGKKPKSRRQLLMEKAVWWAFTHSLKEKARNEIEDYYQKMKKDNPNQFGKLVQDMIAKDKIEEDPKNQEQIVVGDTLERLERWLLEHGVDRDTIASRNRKKEEAPVPQGTAQVQVEKPGGTKEMSIAPMLSVGPALAPTGQSMAPGLPSPTAPPMPPKSPPRPNSPAPAPEPPKKPNPIPSTNPPRPSVVIPCPF